MKAWMVAFTAILVTAYVTMATAVAVEQGRTEAAVVVAIIAWESANWAGRAVSRAVAALRGVTA